VPAIAVYCGPSAEAWTPESQHCGGIGGSETAVIELTVRLARLGWEITVYNRCDAPPAGLSFRGVCYRDYRTFRTEDVFDVLWIWRMPAFFDLNVRARLRLLDLHDALTPFDFTAARVARMDKIFVKSRYHQSMWFAPATRWIPAFPPVPQERFIVVGNGIDLSRFRGAPSRDPYRFMYASYPRRGLEVLLELWPRIRAQIPEATLHVFYGWNAFLNLEKDKPESAEWMRRMQARLRQPGVVDHGRVGQRELAEEELKSSYWLYPTEFREIDCITAKEMQAAGVLPITTGYAALAESQVCGLKIPGDPAWQERYVAEIVGAARGRLRDRVRPETSATRFDWDIVADRWHRELAPE
jgi:glycosyltransferase involved in cell wall biosynthesis